MFPVLPDATHLNDLRFILEQSIDVLTRAITDETLIQPTDDHADFLFRVATKKGELLVWSDVRRMVTMPPLKFQIVFNPYLVNQLETIPASPNTLQVDLALLGNPIREKGNPAYFPFILLLVDSKTGLVLNGDFLSPLPDFDSMLSSLPEVLLKKLIDVRHRPSIIKYRNPDMKIALEFLGQQTNIKVVYSPKLPALDKVLKALRKNI
jgi:hypothetical protein